VSVEVPAPVASTRADHLRAWLWAAALVAVAAGVLHLVVAGQHVQHGGVAVGFFLLVAAAQVGGGVWLGLQACLRSRPDPRLLLLGLLGIVALVALYVVAHTTDLLLGYVSHPPSHDGHTAVHTGPFAAGLTTRNDTLGPVREAPGALGTLTVGLEVGLLMALTALLPGRWRGSVANGLLALGGLGWVLWLTGFLG
jgi:hypothetical protein